MASSSSSSSSSAAAAATDAGGNALLAIDYSRGRLQLLDQVTFSLCTPPPPPPPLHLHYHHHLLLDNPLPPLFISVFLSNYMVNSSSPFSPIRFLTRGAWGNRGKRPGVSRVFRV